MHKKTTIILLSFFLFCSKTPCVQAADTNKFRFAVMGCMHFGIRDSTKDYELAIEKIREYNPDFVVFLGGMIDPLAEGSVESLWQEFDRITGRLDVPIYDVPGNCQLIPSYISEDRLALMKKCFLNRYKERYYSFEHKDNLFICLDSESPDSFDQEKGLIIGDQLDFLKKVTSDASKYSNVFIAIHRPSWFSEKGEWFKLIHPLLRGKVKYVFGASRHLLNQKKIDDVTYIISGCPPLPPEHPVKPYFLHFLIVEVEKDKVFIKVVPVEPIPLENPTELQKDDETKFLPPYLFAKRVYTTYILEAPERVKILEPDRVIEVLKIKPRLTILDIGAGTGFFTFRFADALKGTGKVFATDAETMGNKSMGYMEKKIKEGNYKNIFPVRVRFKGLDPFYKQHTFDIIFLSGVYESILDPEDYFRELRPSLTKDKGRLYIIHTKNDPDFSEFEFDDFKKVFNILTSEGEEFPIFQRLSEEVQDFVKNWKGVDIPSEIRIKIVQNFSKMLLDKFLFNNLLDYYSLKQKYRGPVLLENLLHPLDVRLARWLIVKLEGEGVFNKRKKRLTDIDKRELRRLNRILLTGVFQSDRLYWFTAVSFTCVEKNSIISTLKRAGYRFVREHNFLRNHYFLEFKRKL